MVGCSLMVVRLSLLLTGLEMDWYQLRQYMMQVLDWSVQESDEVQGIAPAAEYRTRAWKMSSSGESVNVDGKQWCMMAAMISTVEFGIVDLVRRNSYAETDM